MLRDLILINPPQHGLLNGFPNALVDLGNYVRHHSESSSVRILDLGSLSPHEARSLLLDELDLCEEPPVVGITTTTASYQNALAIAKTVKANAPECHVVLGGHHVTPQDAIVLKSHPQLVDSVIRGEGERALVALLRASWDLSSVPGISFLSGETVARSTSPPLLTEDELDALPLDFPGLELRCAEGKFYHVTYVSARGCPLKCHFCAVADMPIRGKSIERVRADIETLIERGTTKIAFEDNFFARSRKRTFEICRQVAELRKEHGVDLTWDCQTRVESLRDPNLIDHLARGGCSAVYLGVESLLEDHLRYLGKTVSPARYLELLEEVVVPSLLKSPVDCFINLQLGLPGETEGHRRQTLARLAKLGDMASRAGKTITVFPMLHVIYPGTAHFGEAMAEKRYGPHSEWVFESFTNWEANNEPILNFLGENFAHGVGGIPESILRPESLPTQEYEVSLEGVATTREQLQAMGDLPGIEVFRYGSYLVQPEAAGPEEQGSPGASGPSLGST